MNADLRARLMHQRRTPKGVRCDWCGLFNATDVHHIYERSLTRPDSEARALSEQPELLAVLCKDCHRRAEREPACARAVLLSANEIRYGVARVITAYRVLCATVRIPEYPNGDN